LGAHTLLLEVAGGRLWAAWIGVGVTGLLTMSCAFLFQPMASVSRLSG